MLTEGLVARGHDVTLFASGDSETSAELQAVVATGWSEDPSIDPKVAECLHIANVFERADDFDIIHNSFDFLPLTYCGMTSTPMVTTIHGFSSARIMPAYIAYNGHTSYVSISDADRHPALTYVATIHHGINLEDFDFQPATGEYLVFFGRIHPDKGVVEAIHTASQAGLPLVMAGIVQDETYFELEVAPLIDGKRIQFLGPIPAEGRAAFLGGAAALLHLINFDEPFGFSVAEAMACGTPVVAVNRGSMAELIDHETTGFLVSDVEAAVEAVRNLPLIDRAEVRAAAARKFSSDRMVDEYLAVYEQVLAHRS
jgi:glycosyltransferase involved in cell wall biosynthesis